MIYVQLDKYQIISLHSKIALFLNFIYNDR